MSGCIETGASGGKWSACIVAQSHQRSPIVKFRAGKYRARQLFRRNSLKPRSRRRWWSGCAEDWRLSSSSTPLKRHRPLRRVWCNTTQYRGGRGHARGGDKGIEAIIRRSRADALTPRSLWSPADFSLFTYSNYSAIKKTSAVDVRRSLVAIFHRACVSGSCEV